MLLEMGGALEAGAQQRFVDQESPEGDAWVGHSAVTQRKRGADADLLRDHNHLFDSLSHELVGNGSVAVGVNRVYGRIQHLGGMAGRGRKVEIPARPFLGVSDDDADELRAIAGEHLEGG